MHTKLFFLIATICCFSFSALAQSWHVIPSGTSKKLNTISFPSSTVGYIGGADSLILKTTNGGITWTPLNYSGITFYPEGDDIVDIVFPTENVGFLTVGPYSGTYKTVDGGLTWSLVDNIYMCFNSALYMFDNNNGFLGGAGCFSGEIINRLSNGTWNETNVNPSYIVQDGMINNFDFWSANFGMATGTGDYFFRTINGGVTWDTIPNGLNDDDTLTSIQFVDSLRVLATFTHVQTGGFGVLISQDAGLTWQPEMNSATFFYPNMFALEKPSNGHIYIGGENSFTSGGIDPGLIYHSNGNLSNWSYQSVAESVRAMDSYNDSIVFAVGENGYIIVNQHPTTLSMIEDKQLLAFIINPNPCYGTFHLAGVNNQVEGITIHDTKGIMIQDLRMNSVEEMKTLTIEVPAGVYHVFIHTKRGRVMKKVVVL